MGLQAQQIVTLACQIAKCTGFVSQAGQMLNLILNDLCQTYDFDVARAAYTFTFNSAAGAGAGPYNLPSDYLRAIADDVYYTVTGVPNRMSYALADEFDLLIQTPGITGYPVRFFTDMAS